MRRTVLAFVLGLVLGILGTVFAPPYLAPYVPGFLRPSAMAEAEVGDDVLGKDPTAARLERRVAELLGKEDALFFPSGTQANQTAIILHTRPGSEAVCEAESHVFHYEYADAAWLAGVQLHPVRSDRGTLEARDYIEGGNMGQLTAAAGGGKQASCGV